MMNVYDKQDEPLPEEFQYCNYTMTTDRFDWYCALPAHPSMPHDHYMQSCVRSA